jgi:hypothetical protein
MQIARYILLAVLLFGLVAGCGGPAVEVPDNPAPKPNAKAKPVRISSSLPAKPAPAKSR